MNAGKRVDFSYFFSFCCTDRKPDIHIFHHDGKWFPLVCCRFIVIMTFHATFKVEFDLVLYVLWNVEVFEQNVVLLKTGVLNKGKWLTVMGSFFSIYFHTCFDTVCFQYSSKSKNIVY